MYDFIKRWLCALLGLAFIAILGGGPAYANNLSTTYRTTENICRPYPDYPGCTVVQVRPHDSSTRKAQFKGTAPNYARHLWGQHHHGYIFGHLSRVQNSRFYHLYTNAVRKYQITHTHTEIAADGSTMIVPDAVIYPSWSGFKANAFAGCTRYNAKRLYP